MKCHSRHNEEANDLNPEIMMQFSRMKHFKTHAKQALAAGLLAVLPLSTALTVAMPVQAAGAAPAAGTAQAQAMVALPAAVASVSADVAVAQAAPAQQAQVPQLPTVLGAAVTATGVPAVAPGAGQLFYNMTPSVATVNGIGWQSVSGLQFGVTQDFNDPYIIYTKAFGAEYNRMMGVQLYIKNTSKTTVHITQYTQAFDAKGTPLVNVDDKAGWKFTELAPGGQTCVLGVYKLRPSDDVNNMTFVYDHLDYGDQYIYDMNLYAAGLISLEQLRQMHPAVPVTFQITGVRN